MVTMTPPPRKWREPGQGPRPGAQFAKDGHADAAAKDFNVWNTDYECGRNGAAFFYVEQVITSHLDRKRDVWSPEAEGADRISTVLEWCTRCPIMLSCYQRMTKTTYTGVAGGTILHHGKPVPRPPRGDQLNLFRD